MEDLFGELRSYLQQKQLDDVDREELYELLFETWETDLDVYQNQWVEYIKGFPHHLVHPLAEFRHLKDLESLASMMPFARFSLKQLDMGLCDDDIQAITNAPFAHQLAQLELSHNQITDEGVKALVQLPHLIALNLGSNKISEIGVSLIAQTPHLCKLTTLNLGGNALGDECIKPLARSPYLSALTTLTLYSSHIGDLGVKTLAQSPNMTHLKHLGLTTNRIGDPGVKAIAASPT